MDTLKFEFFGVEIHRQEIAALIPSEPTMIVARPEREPRYRTPTEIFMEAYDNKQLEDAPVDKDAEDFKRWMAAVEREIDASTGLASADLEDYCYRDRFDDGMSAKNAAKSALKRSGYTR